MASKFTKSEKYYWERAIIDIELACKSKNPVNIYFAGECLLLAFGFHTIKEMAQICAEKADDLTRLRLSIDSAQVCFKKEVFFQYFLSGIQSQLEFREAELGGTGTAAEFSGRVMNEVYPERKRRWRDREYEMAYPKEVQ